MACKYSKLGAQNGCAFDLMRMLQPDLSSSTGTPSTASCVSTDRSHEPCLQKLLSAGVQAVQFLHGACQSFRQSVNLIIPNHWVGLTKNLHLKRSDCGL